MILNLDENNYVKIKQKYLPRIENNQLRRFFISNEIGTRPLRMSVLIVFKNGSWTGSIRAVVKKDNIVSQHEVLT